MGKQMFVAQGGVSYGLNKAQAGWMGGTRLSFRPSLKWAWGPVTSSSLRTLSYGLWYQDPSPLPFFLFAEDGDQAHIGPFV